jgi:hypothetical protein
MSVLAVKGGRLTLWVSGLSLTLWLFNGVTPAKADERAKGGETRKPAWQWTVDERLAQRFDPEAMKARASQRLAEEQAYLKRFPQERAAISEEEGPPIDRVDGDKNPELFLPFELFDILIDTGFPREGEDHREPQIYLEERAAALGFGRDLWTRLGRVAGTLVRLRNEADEQQRMKSQFPGSRAEAQTVNSSGMANEGVKLCRARAKAIAAAKAEFGEEAFLRLLYIGVTPGISRTGIIKDGNVADHRRRLNYIEGGCR